MTRSDKLRQKKNKQRREAARHRVHNRRQHMRNQELWPQIVHASAPIDHVPLPFINAVEAALKEVRVSDPGLFSAEMRQHFKDLKALGVIGYGKKYGNAHTIFEAACTADRLVSVLAELSYRTMLRSRPEVRAYWPFCGFRLIPTGDILLKYDAMIKAKGPYGSIYYSPLKPTVLHNGQHRIVGYTRHAAERIAERLGDTSLIYCNSRTTSEYLIYYVHYEIVAVTDEHRSEMAAVLYRTLDDAHYYKVGYAPLCAADQFLVAKTLLIPGMRGTAEGELIHREIKSHSERCNMKESLHRIASGRDQLTDYDQRTIEWFAEHGMKQLTTFDTSPYHPYDCAIDLDQAI